MSDISDIIKNPTLKMYLEYTKMTETPSLFHVWCALSAAGAAMGRHLYMDDSGVGAKWGNMYVILVGPPGTRKSAGIDLIRGIIEEATNIRFAPDDTGGLRQGLLSAMLDKDKTEKEDETFEEIFNAGNAAAAIANLAQMPVALRRPEDRHCMFGVASELNTFLGQNSLDMITFLTKMWDGEDYVYTLSKIKRTMKNGLFGLLGGTTTTNIATHLPKEAVGQGFTSRIILVYQSEKREKIPRRRLRKELKEQLVNAYRKISVEMSGGITESEEAADYFDKIYMQDFKMEDERFVYYAERRHTHLIKISMALTVLRGSMQIEIDDINEALAILKYTEMYMPSALGEYGMSQLSTHQHKVLEYLERINMPKTEIELWAIYQRDMTLHEFKLLLNNLHQAGKIIVGRNARQETTYEAFKKPNVDLALLAGSLV